MYTIGTVLLHLLTFEYLFHGLDSGSSRHRDEYLIWFCKGSYFSQNSGYSMRLGSYPHDLTVLNHFHIVGRYVHFGAAGVSLCTMQRVLTSIDQTMYNNL